MLFEFLVLVQWSFLFCFLRFLLLFFFVCFLVTSFILLFTSCICLDLHFPWSLPSWLPSLPDCLSCPGWSHCVSSTDPSFCAFKSLCFPFCLLVHHAPCSPSNCPYSLLFPLCSLCVWLLCFGVALLVLFAWFLDWSLISTLVCQP